MMRIITLGIIMLCISFSADAQKMVMLAGTVKKTGTAVGLKDARVSLARLSDLSDITDAEGKFRIEETSIREMLPQALPFQFNLKGNSIVFSPVAREITGSMEIFSGNGKRIFSSGLNLTKEGPRSIDIPKLGSGINIMRITIDGKNFTRTLISMGNGLFLEKAGSGQGSSRNFSLKGQSSIAPLIDTLIVSKEGYTTKKIHLDSYYQEGLVVELDSVTGNNGKCTRESLQELINGYVAALEAGDSSKMALAPNAKYQENMRSSSFSKGIWTKKIKVSFHRDFFDVDSCSAFTELYDSISPHPYNIGAQIRTSGGEITSISALVADSGDWLINKHKDIATMVKVSSAEKWTLIPADKQNTRDSIQKAGDLYLDIFYDKSVKVPWGTPCTRLEGAATTGNRCDVGIPDNLRITDRQYIVDVDMGTVSIFCKFGGNMPDSHLFRVEDGKLRYVHTISIQN